MLSPVKILRKTIVNALINRKTTVNCEVLRKTSVPCSIEMEHIIFPVFVSAEVGTINSNTWVIIFSEDLANVIPLVAENAFISVGFTFNSITKTGAREIRLVSDQDVVFGQVLTLQYNKSLTLNPLQGTNGVKVSSFTKSVTNNVLQAPLFVSAEVGLIDAYTIDVLFDRALNEARIPDVADLIPLFSGGANTTKSVKPSGLHTYIGLGADDWFLPAKDEQSLMNSVLSSIANFQDGNYWSSSEAGALTAYVTNLLTGVQVSTDKSNIAIVRPIRSFTSTLTYALGDVGPAGGWVFRKSGNDYLECASADLGSYPVWSNISLLIGTTSTAVGTGQTNTTAIIGQAGHTSSAAKLCNDLVIGRAITAGETGTIQYIPNALEAKKLQGTNGAKVAAFTKDVTNNVTDPELPTNVTVTLIVGGYRITWDDPVLPYFRIEIYRTILGGSETFIATLASGVETWDDLVDTGIQITYRLRTVILSAAYEAETTALIQPARFTTPPTAEFIDLINTTIKGIKDDGVSLGDCFHVFTSHDALFARQNWAKNDHNAGLIATPVFTAKEGYKFNGTNNALNLDYKPKTDAVTTALNGYTSIIWNRLQPTINGRMTKASYNPAIPSGIRHYHYTAANEACYLNSWQTNSNINVIDDDCLGFTRNGTSVQGYKNGVPSGAAVTCPAFTEMPDFNMYLGAYLIDPANPTNIGTMSDGQVRFNYEGPVLNDAQMLALYTRVKYFMDNMAATF